MDAAPAKATVQRSDASSAESSGTTPPTAQIKSAARSATIATDTGTLPLTAARQKAKAKMRPMGEAVVAEKVVEDPAEAVADTVRPMDAAQAAVEADTARPMGAVRAEAAQAPPSAARGKATAAGEADVARTRAS